MGAKINDLLEPTRGVYRGEVDATCVQFGSRGERIPPSRGKNSTFKGEEFLHRYMGHT